MTLKDKYYYLTMNWTNNGGVELPLEDWQYKGFITIFVAPFLPQI